MPNKNSQRYRLELGKWEAAAAESGGEHSRRILVIGHRNPDTDSVASAVGYAALKHALGETGYQPACAGLPQKRTAFVFRRFKTPLPRVLGDVWPTVGDIVHPCGESLICGQTLLQATEILRRQRVERLPVVDNDGKYQGMVSLFDLADRLFQNSGREGEGILDRSVKTTISLAAHALEAEVLCQHEPDVLDLFQIYVGAMNLYHMKERLLEGGPRNAALVVGDRGEIHSLAVDIGVRLLVITGNCEIDSEFIKQAQKNGVSILRTVHDSASTVRRLKFSSPVDISVDANLHKYTPGERLREVRREVLSANYDGFPVVGEDEKLVGMFYKHDLQKKPPLGLVLVDHNELQQAVEGAEDVPILEIIDHHRIGIAHTDAPIRVLNDIVGSTCTLVSEQYRLNGLTPEKDIAGILLCGIIADTLLLRSPTSTPRDQLMLEWLSGICGCDPAELEKEILASGSPLANLTPPELVNADLKRYEEGSVHFAIGQIEEAGFENLAGRIGAVREELERRLQNEKLAFIGLMVTNVVRSTSVMLVAGDQMLLKRLPFERLEKGMYDLPGIVSRKKELLPLLISIFTDNAI